MSFTVSPRRYDLGFGSLGTSLESDQTRHMQRTTIPGDYGLERRARSQERPRELQ